jgi:hypothetical protein
VEPAKREARSGWRLCLTRQEWERDEKGALASSKKRSHLSRNTLKGVLSSTCDGRGEKRGGGGSGGRGHGSLQRRND